MILTLDEFIEKLQSELLIHNSIEVLCYYYLTEKQYPFETNNFTGEVEKNALKGFVNQFVDKNDLNKIIRKLSNNQYEKAINIFQWIGLCLLDKLNETNDFTSFLKEKFNSSSYKYKYLISKVFEDEYEDNLKKYIIKEIDNNEPFVSLLKHIYLEEEINVNKVLQKIQKSNSNDIIDLLILEDLQNISKISYNRLQKKLWEDLLWVLTELQNNHKNFNNSEDQYNAAVRSLLTAKGYDIKDQTQRGTSSKGVNSGELDIMIFDKKSMPLSILESFNLNSIDTKSIIEHLTKLSEKYDSNGLRNNYAVIYAKNGKFDEFWKRYREFVPTIDFEHKLNSDIVEDITSQYPDYAGIRLGLTKHYNRGKLVNIFHVFMDMNF